MAEFQNYLHDVDQNKNFKELENWPASRSRPTRPPWVLCKATTLWSLGIAVSPKLSTFGAFVSFDLFCVSKRTLLLLHNTF
jgi:hypothetical protein